MLRAFRTSQTESLIIMSGLMPLDYRVLELTPIRYLESFNDKNKFFKSASIIATKAISATNLNISYDRAKFIRLPDIPPWYRNHPQEMQSPSSTTLTSSDPTTTNIFTDGLIWKYGAGFSALICFSPELKHSLFGSLPRHTTIFQAEGHAILADLKRIVSTNPHPSQRYEIYPDSKSALAACTPTATTKSSQPFFSIVKICLRLKYKTCLDTEQLCPPWQLNGRLYC
jgi:hypothetical protein